MNYPTLNETERLSFLDDLEALGSLDGSLFDRFVEAARRIFSVPYALINFIGQEQVCIKAGGSQEVEIARENAFCNYTILHDTVMVIPDARCISGFSDNPFVLGEPYVRFYAGAPLIVAPGIRIGALCVIDTVPRSFDQRQMDILAGLARLIVDEIWLQRTLICNGADVPFALTEASGEVRLTAPKALSGAQLRAARALLDWSIAMLASESNISVNTIKRFEGRANLDGVRSASLDALRSTLEGHGVRFADGGGVALKPRVR